MTDDSQCWGRFTQVYVSIKTTLATASAVDGTLIYLFVRNKAKGRISKRVFQENKARQIFRKNEYFLSPGVLCFLEKPILKFALLAYYRRIEIYSPRLFKGMGWMRSGKVVEINPSGFNAGRREKINLNFYFHIFVVPQKVLWRHLLRHHKEVRK